MKHDRLNVESKSLEILLLGSPKGSTALVNNCLSGSRRLGMADSDETHHLDFSRCNHCQNTVVCNTLTAGAISFLSFLSIGRKNKKVRECVFSHSLCKIRRRELDSDLEG